MKIPIQTIIFFLSLVYIPLFACESQEVDLFDQTEIKIENFLQKENKLENCKELNETFQKLRKKFREIIFLQHGYYPYTNCLALDLDARAVTWYTEFMDDVFFSKDENQN